MWNRTRLLTLLTALAVLLPAALFAAPSTAFAQGVLVESRSSGKRVHKRAHRKSTSRPAGKVSRPGHGTRRHQGQRTERRARSTRHHGHHSRVERRRTVVHRRPVHVHRRERRVRVHHRHHHRPVYRRHHVHSHHFHHERHFVRPVREVIVIHVDDPDPILPELDCPVGTDEERSGLTQWCSTPRGVKHGPYTRWHDNGQIAVEGEYAYGERDGMWIRWYDDGGIIEEGAYLDGQKIGTWIRWDRDGDEISVHEYD